MTTMRRHRRERDETGSMAFFLVLSIVGMAIAALLVPMIVTSSQATRSDTSRTRALDAAQAGINVMIGEIRAAKVDDVVGTSTKLPCDDRSGVVNSVGDPSYTVSVAYFTVDPVKASGTQKMTCVNGYGTYDPVSQSFTPKFARITAFGRDGTARSGSTPGRKLEATYVLRTTNSNIVGGRVRPQTNPQLCWDAGMAQPTAGASIFLRDCGTPPQDQQLIAYRTDLTLQLLSSITGTNPDGLCLDSATPPAAGNPIILKRCNPLGAPVASQQWSYNDNGGYTAPNADSAATGALSGVCISVASLSAGAQVVLTGCNGGAANQQWNPDASVGAGAAQAPQLVNFFEFGRCLDVTNQDPRVNALIDYPCKQNPLATAVRWNQKWTLPPIATGATRATGQITADNGTVYCLTSPRTESGAVVVRACDNPTAQTWTVYGGATALSYSAKYTLVDSAGLCLGLVPRGTDWSTPVVETCTGATEQKWNATADLTATVLQDIDEVRP